jgi:hypothetical protein
LLHRSISQGDLAEASILCTLVQLLEKIWAGGGEMDLAELNTASGVIQRLIASSQQIAELRQRFHEIAPTIGGGERNRDNGLPEPIIEQLEERLKLL